MRLPPIFTNIDGQPSAQLSTRYRHPRTKWTGACAGWLAVHPLDAVSANLHLSIQVPASTSLELSDSSFKTRKNLMYFETGALEDAVYNVLSPKLCLSLFRKRQQPAPSNRRSFSKLLRRRFRGLVLYG